MHLSPQRGGERKRGPTCLRGRQRDGISGASFTEPRLAVPCPRLCGIAPAAASAVEPASGAEAAQSNTQTNYASDCDSRDPRRYQGAIVGGSVFRLRGEGLVLMQTGQTAPRSQGCDRVRRDGSKASSAQIHLRRAPFSGQYTRAGGNAGAAGCSQNPAALGHRHISRHARNRPIPCAAANGSRYALTSRSGRIDRLQSKNHDGDDAEGSGNHVHVLHFHPAPPTTKAVIRALNFAVYCLKNRSRFVPE